MSKDTVNHIRLGVFVVLGGILLITGLYYIGNKQNLFSETYTLYTRFNDVNGLQNGNNVRFSGIDVGTVTAMEFQNDTSILVTMVIEKNLERFIRKNSLTSIGTDGLMGNKLVNIDPGTPDFPTALAGDELPARRSLDTDRMLRTLDATNRNVLEISSNLRNITKDIREYNGNLYSLMLDTTVAGNLKNTLNNLELVSNNLGSFSERLDVLFRDIQAGKGLAGELTKENSGLSMDVKKTVQSIRESGANLDSLTREVRGLVEQVRNGKGSSGLLISDTAAAGNLKRTLSNLDTSTVMVNEYLKALRYHFLFKSYFKKLDKVKNN